jgi:hypothetical protein
MVNCSAATLSRTPTVPSNTRTHAPARPGAIDENIHRHKGNRYYYADVGTE